MKNDVYEHQRVLNTKIKKYLICQQLGSGSSAYVYLAINQENNQQVAIKVIPKAYLNSDKKLMELVKTEINILKTCDNENIVKCYDVLQTKVSIFIVMEYCNGLDMEKYVKNKKYLSEDHAVWYLKQMLNGFKGLHEIGAMHRDFKLPNLLLHDRVCKIADMGFAKQIKEEQLTSTILGTEITMAPEVLERKPYGINADIWSLGVVFYQMLTGKYPYKGVSRMDLLKNIKKNPNDFSQLRVSSMAKNFLQGCLTYQPSKRISWMEIYNHPLLNKTTIQLIYGISNTSQIFYQNQGFYRRQSYDESEDSILILRNSSRKDLIIQEISESQKKSDYCATMLRNSLQRNQPPKTLITYGVHYGVYLNQLIFPMKFFDLEKISHLPQIEHFIFIYLIYKKCLNQMRELHYVVKKRMNIFKIQNLWKQFTKSNIYNDVTSIVQSCFTRAEGLFGKVQAVLKQKKWLGQIQDQRIIKELSEAGIKRKEFEELLDGYLKNYARDLFKLLKLSQKPQNLDLIDICQALVFYIDKGGKEKLTPQRFDWGLTRNVDYNQTRCQLINKFQSLLGN